MMMHLKSQFAHITNRKHRKKWQGDNNKHTLCFNFPFNFVSCLPSSLSHYTSLSVMPPLSYYCCERCFFAHLAHMHTTTERCELWKPWKKCTHTHTRRERQCSCKRSTSSMYHWMWYGYECRYAIGLHVSYAIALAIRIRDKQKQQREKYQAHSIYSNTQTRSSCTR